jgi:CelD/BcsL family acetyltransferase involved in cellulose biosynthesis
VTSSAPKLLVLRQLGSWACRWDRLVDSSPVPSPFMRSWWLAGTAGPHSCFLLVALDDQLLGGLALEEGRRLGVPCLRMMGAGPLCPDHLDLLTAPGHESTVVNLVARWLSRPGSRLLDLEGVLEPSKLINALPGTVRREPIAAAPWTSIPADSSAYIDARPANFRRNLKRASARLAAAGATHQVNRGTAAVERLNVLRELHEGQWGDRSNFLPSFDAFAEGCRLAAEFDEIAVHELCAGKTVAAILVAFEVAQRVSLYQSARLTENRWREASTVLLAATVTDACERGFTEVDFLRGDEPYKRNFTSQRRELLRLQTATGWPSKLAMIAQVAARRAKPVLSSIINDGSPTGKT